MSAPTPEGVFALYPRLAANVTNLRTILQNPEHVTKEDIQFWSEDVKTVLKDLMELAETTAIVLRSLPQFKE